MEAPVLTRPPFAVVGSLGPLQVGAELVACFAQLGGRTDRLEHAHTLASRSIGLPETDPLLVAGLAIARDIDHGIGAGVAAGYHNGQHFLEVMLCALYLARLACFDPRRTARVVTAALMHDFHHDGKGNAQIPFRLERISVNRSASYLSAACMPEIQRRNIAALVLATEVVNGLAIAHACHAYHDGAALLPEIHAAAPELAQLAAYPIVSRQALIVCEADVLPSIGLDIEHALQLQTNLSMEQGRHLGLKDKYRFVTEGFPGFIIGIYFQPNLERLRQFLRERMNLDTADQSDAD